MNTTWESLASANSLIDVARFHCNIELELDKASVPNKLVRITRGELMPHLFPPVPGPDSNPDPNPNPNLNIEGDSDPTPSTTDSDHANTRSKKAETTSMTKEKWANCVPLAVRRPVRSLVRAMQKYCWPRAR